MADELLFDDRWRSAQACDDAAERNDLLCAVDFTRGAAQEARVVKLALETPATCGKGWEEALKRASFGWAEDVNQFAQDVRDTLNEDTRVKTIVFAATKERAGELAHRTNGIALCTEEKIDDYLQETVEPPHRVIAIWAPLRRRAWGHVFDVGPALVAGAPWAFDRVYVDLADHVHGSTSIDYHASTMQRGGIASSPWGSFNPLVRKFAFIGLPQDARTVNTRVTAATSSVCNQCTRGTNWAEQQAPDATEPPHWACAPPPFLCEIAGREIPREYKLALYLRAGFFSALEIIDACNGKVPYFPSVDVWREMRNAE